MKRRSIAHLLMSASVVTSVAVHAATPAPGKCANDSKLLNDGPTQISGEGPGTWWGLVINGLLVAGFVDEDDPIDYLNDIFGTSFGTLDELKAYNLQLVADTWDENRNGYVCAFQLRGTRAHFDNPYVDLTFFGVGDDRIAKK